MEINFNTPILFLIFNRPDTTQKVFDVIKRVQPKQLFVAADGPRSNKLGEKEKCEETRKIINQINWDCEVRTLFRDENLGCGKAVSGAITWFFKNVEEGIILEDDCLPNESFFTFCKLLLEKYRYNDEIAIISGNNFNKQKIGNADYYFSKISHIWGWATWRRTWNKYDIKISEYTNFKKEKKIEKIWSNSRFQKYWIYIFDEVYNNNIKTWDYQLVFSLFLNNSLCICPNVNLVSNIGFGKDFTNTILIDKNVSNLEVGNLKFPLIYTNKVEFDEKNNYLINKTSSRYFELKKFLKKIGVFNFIKKVYIKLK